MVSGRWQDGRQGTGSGIALLTSPLVVAVVTFALTRPTLMPGVAFLDTGEFQTVGPLLGTAHSTGYPSYVILGWIASVLLQPFGEPAFRMNLLAALLAAVTAGLCAVLVEQLTRRPLLAAAAGLIFGALPAAWQLATHADPHGLHVALVALLFVLLVAWEDRRGDRWLVAATVVFGIAVGNHSLTFFLAPGIALFLLAVEPGILARRRFVVSCTLLLLVTAGAVYMELPLRAGPFRAPLVYGRPETLDGFLYVVFGVQFLGDVDWVGDLGARLADLARFAGVQLGPLAILVPFGMLATAVRRPRYALLSFPPLVITCWFAASYENAGIERYYLVPALIAVTWVAILIDELIGLVMSPRGRRGAPRTRKWAVAPALEVGVAVLIILPTLGTLPARAAEVDRSDDRAAAEWLDLTFAQLEPNEVVVSWWDFSTPLWYAQLCQGRRRDVWVVDDRTILDEGLGDVSHVIDANLGQRPVYLIRQPAEIATLATRYRLESLPAPSFQALDRVLGPIGDGS